MSSKSESHREATLSFLNWTRNNLKERIDIHEGIDVWIDRSSRELLGVATRTHFKFNGSVAFSKE